MKKIVGRLFVLFDVQSIEPRFVGALGCFIYFDASFHITKEQRCNTNAGIIIAITMAAEVEVATAAIATNRTYVITAPVAVAVAAVVIFVWFFILDTVV